MRTSSTKEHLRRVHLRRALLEKSLIQPLSMMRNNRRVTMKACAIRLDSRLTAMERASPAIVLPSRPVHPSLTSSCPLALILPSLTEDDSPSIFLLVTFLLDRPLHSCHLLLRPGALQK